jgi:hypothetical protein
MTAINVLDRTRAAAPAIMKTFTTTRDGRNAYG